MQNWPADKVERRPLSELVPYARNSRTHSDEQVAQIAASMQEWGWTNPVLVDEAGMIIAGHGRVLAARKLGFDEAPVMVASGWTEAQKRAYVLADNQLALNAGWDGKMLSNELRGLRDDWDFDLSLLGFPDLDALLADKTEGLTDPDHVPDAPVNPVTRSGDLWCLGVHRVKCGDATNVADVETLMGGLMADGCWTDPPYNVNYGSKLAGKIQNDSMGDEPFGKFLRDAFASAFLVMKPGSAIYVAHADTEGLNFRSAFKDAGFKISGCLIWAKDSLVLGRSDYQWQHEPILYGWKPGAAHRWYGGRKQTTITQLSGSAFVQNEDGTVTVTIGGESIVITGENLKAIAADPTIIRVEKPRRSGDHPTMKPVELISRMLRNSTREGDIVLDLFGGSGSTLIACETLGRQSRLMELDAKFVDVIVKRWQAFTGKTATLDGDGRSFDEIDTERFDAGENHQNGAASYDVAIAALRERHELQAAG